MAVKIEQKNNYVFVTDTNTNTIISSFKSELKFVKNPDLTYDLVYKERVIHDNKSLSFFQKFDGTPFADATEFENFVTTVSGFNFASVEGLDALADELDQLGTDFTNHETNTSNPHSVTKTQIGLSNVDNTSDLDKPISNATQIALDNKIETSLIGVPNGVALLNENGFVPSENLPSYVDDVLEFEDLASFPIEGEEGKIYVAKDTNLTYRWSGTVYVNVASTNLSLQEVIQNGGTFINDTIELYFNEVLNSNNGSFRVKLKEIIPDFGEWELSFDNERGFIVKHYSQNLSLALGGNYISLGNLINLTQSIYLLKDRGNSISTLISNLDLLQNVIFVNSLADLPIADSGVITLSANTTYLFNAGTFNFSDRIVLSNNSMLIGQGKTNTILNYSGVSNFISGTNVNSNIRDIEFQTPNGTLFNISNSSSFSLYLEQLNFRNCLSCGSLSGGVFAEYILAVTCGTGLLMSGTLGSVVLDTVSFRSMTGGVNSYAIKISNGSTGNSFRVYNSIFDVSAGHYGIWIESIFTLSSGGVLKGNIFTGAGNRLNGVNGNTANWTIIHGENSGIAGLQYVDIEINTTDASLGNGSGTYIDGGSVKGFALNIANYDPFATVMQAKISALFTTSVGVEVGVRNHTDSLNIAGLSTPTTGTNVIIESPFVTITSGKEYTGYYVKPTGAGTTRKSLKLTLKIY